MVFLVKLANGIDPGIVELFPLETKNGNRRTQEDPENKSRLLRLPLDIKKFGESSYSLTPASPLDPGEYFFQFQNVERCLLFWYRFGYGK